MTDLFRGVADSIGDIGQIADQVSLQLASIIDGALLGSIRKDEEGRRAEAILGYPVERWLEENDFWARILHPDDRERVRDVRITRAPRLPFVCPRREIVRSSNQL